MPSIAYNQERLLYDPSVLKEGEKGNFIIRDISEDIFRILQRLPSQSFQLGTNVRELVENLLSKEKIEQAT